MSAGRRQRTNHSCLFCSLSLCIVVLAACSWGDVLLTVSVALPTLINLDNSIWVRM